MVSFDWQNAHPSLEFFMLVIINLMSQRDQNPLLTQQRYKSILQISLITLNLTLSSFYFGYSIKYFSTIQFTVISNLLYPTDLSQGFAKGLANGSISLGALFGALFSSILLAKLSRRMTLLVINTIALAAGLLIFVRVFYFLLIVRLIQGFCVGVYSAVVPLIIKEIVPIEISGTMGTFTQFSIAFGVFFAGILEYALVKIFDDPTGKTIYIPVFAFTLFTLALQTLLLLFKYNFQTPKYLLQKGNTQQARKLIALLYKQEFVDEVLQQKQKDFQALAPKEDSASSSIVSDFPTFKAKPTTLTAVIAIHLAALQQMSGINAVVTYGGQTIQPSFPDLFDILSTLINFTQVLAVFITGILIAKVGRKTILTVGSFAQGISCAIVGVGCLLHSTEDNANNQFSNLMILLGLFLYMGIFGMSLGPLVWLYIPQIVQPKVIPYSTVTNWICAFLVTFLFPVVQGAIGGNAGILFLFFSVWCIVSGVFNIFYLVETKDKSERQITEEYRMLQPCS